MLQTLLYLFEKRTLENMILIESVGETDLMERICYDGADSAFCQKLKAGFPFSFLKNQISDAHSITHIVGRDISH